MKKIMKLLIPCVMIFLIVGISVQYYITMPTSPESLVCHKGKLLAQVEGEGTVYTRIKKFSCDYEKGMLIIEEQS